MRTLIISDIHGCFTQLSDAVRKVAPGSEDTVIFLGDYFDRGPDSFGVFRFLQKMSTEYRCFFLRGNHEDMLLDYFADAPSAARWIKNGYLTTLDSFSKNGADVRDAIPWILEHTQYFVKYPTFEVCHGGTICARLEENDPFDIVWDRSCVREMNYDGKLLIVGHTPVNMPALFTGGTSTSYDYGIWYDLPKTGVLDIDTACVYGVLEHTDEHLTILEIVDQKMRFHRSYRTE